jgi:hypothetical protein
MCCLSEFETTEILDIAIATDANIGFNNTPKNGYSTPIATGIRTILYPNAQKRFCLIVLMVLLDNSIDDATEFKFLLTNVILDASIATSVPVPMAMPTSALASAGASLIPSPTIATFLPSA